LTIKLNFYKHRAIKSALSWAGYPRSADYESGANLRDGGVVERRDIMKSRVFLWLVAAMIGSALALSPVISAPAFAQEKKEEKKGEEKKKSEGKKSDEKKSDEKKKEEKK
jgi:hypothetical protein